MGPLKRKSESNLLEEVPKDEPGAINENPPVKKLKQKHQDKETLKVKPEKVIEEKNENSNKDRSTELLDEATAVDDEGGKRKRHGRKRKKKCYTEILKQMEFYFSDANIAKSAFMQEALKKSEWLNLATFMKFNKVAGMLEAAFERVDPSDLFKALNALPSELLEVRQTDSVLEIRRKKAITSREKIEEDACTVYVENLPANATIDNVTKFFEKFGKVLYVSLPKYKVTQAIKGFAFVEFEKAEWATNVVKASAVEKKKLRSDMDPSELLSIKTFLAEQQQQQTQQTPDKDSPQKQVKSERSDQDGASTTTAATKEKKKSRGKKNKTVKNGSNGLNGPHPIAFQHPLPDLPIDFTGLQILSKAEWKKLRNTYLNLQRKNVGQAKQKIRQFHQQQQQQQQQQLQEPPRFESQNDVQDSKAAKVDEGLAFEPKVVVEFNVEEPIFDVTMLKKKIKAAVMEPVKYIDARPGATSFYVRCGCPDQAKTLANVKILGDGKVLADEEEKDYWEKANRDRQEKIGGKIKLKQTHHERGKDKVVRQYKEMEEAKHQSNTHKFFDDDE